mmetsp:Transcript_61922/g.145126  ORF Transcript_61922/g.145126 Transcript_61922/m.145126 type:complete len:200 (-) Transcript_61922:112-711(-)
MSAICFLASSSSTSVWRPWITKERWLTSSGDKSSGSLSGCEVNEASSTVSPVLLQNLNPDTMSTTSTRFRMVPCRRARPSQSSPTVMGFTSPSSLLRDARFTATFLLAARPRATAWIFMAARSSSQIALAALAGTVPNSPRGATAQAANSSMLMTPSLLRSASAKMESRSSGLKVGSRICSTAFSSASLIFPSPLRSNL